MMTLVELERSLNRAQKLVHTQSAEALQLALSAKPLAQQLKAVRLFAQALFLCAQAHFNFGRYPESLRDLADLNALANLENIARYEGARLNLYARVQYTLGAYHLARDSWNRCLTLPDEAIALESRVQAHIGLGQLYYAHEHYQTALTHHRKAQELASHEDHHLHASILINIAADLIGCAQLDEAYRNLKSALPLVKADQSYRNEGEIYMNIGLIQFLRGDLDRATISLMVALKINRLHHHQWSEANTMLVLGRCQTAKGDVDLAIETLQSALHTASHLGIRHQQASIHAALAQSYTVKHDLESAQHHQAQHQHLRLQLRNEIHQAELETMELPFA
ncbi:hypothetical protein [Deefgea piscis]|uniref:hypothetical protein n=1 Tax=Deefgea piscis TaxID=2739061 RepID=UPI001C80839E|nr:hypothetical protein [Deefgea piscis]QZA80487.1 hypothetical protein K4H25_13320 [Deefgea piscis]